MDFNSIGYFQFNNLVQSRVPLVLLLLDSVDLKPWYNSIVHMHLENVSINCKPNQALEVIKEKNLPPHYAIVALDLHGQTSPSVVTELEGAGFINVYYVKGGFVGIAQEKSMI